MDLFCYLCFVFMFVILSFLFLTAMCSPAGKGLNFWLYLLEMFSCVFVTFPYGVLCRVRYLIVSIPNLDFILTLIENWSFWPNLRL